MTIKQNLFFRQGFAKVEVAWFLYIVVDVSDSSPLYLRHKETL
jgi:hypothetical protein